MCPVGSVELTPDGTGIFEEVYVHRLPLALAFVAVFLLGSVVAVGAGPTLDEIVSDHETRIDRIEAHLGLVTTTPEPTATNTSVSPTATATATSTSTTPTPTETGDAPVAGQLCPAWVHDQYQVEVDGESYPTWHPAIDPSGCHFGHEHGSNPNKVPGAKKPAFGYGTPDHMHESGFGFKVKALHAENGIQVLATTHFGTAHPEGAVCQRFHWNNWQFVQNGEVVADITFLADFGAARKNDTNQLLNHSCPNPDTGQMMTQEDIARVSYGVRLNPVGTSGPFYYPWRMDTRGVTRVIGFEGAGYTVNTPTVVAACKDMQCNERVMIGGHGAWAMVAFGNGFGVKDVGNNGYFYTNKYGTEKVDANHPEAVRQYVKPGVNISLAKLSDNHSYFPTKSGGGFYGDYIYKQLANGDRDIADHHREAVDPAGVLGDPN